MHFLQDHRVNIGSQAKLRYSVAQSISIRDEPLPCQQRPPPDPHSHCQTMAHLHLTMPRYGWAFPVLKASFFFSRGFEYCPIRALCTVLAFSRCHSGQMAHCNGFMWLGPVRCNHSSNCIAIWRRCRDRTFLVTILLLGKPALIFTFKAHNTSSGSSQSHACSRGPVARHRLCHLP